MTVAADLATDAGIHRRLFLKIDGVKEILWQNSPTPGLDGKPVNYEGPPGGHPLLPETIALWRCDEWGSGEDLKDSSTNSLDLTVTGTPGVLTQNTTPSAVVCNARGMFDNTSYFSRADEALLRPQRFTIALWAYNNNSTQPVHAKIIVKELAGTASHSFSLKCTDGGVAIMQTGLTFTSGSSTVTADDAISVGWHHLVVTWDGTTHSLYTDGVLTGSNAPGADKTIDYDANPLMVGTDDDYKSTQYWDGGVDDIALYPFAVSAEWVRRAYNGGNGYTRPGLNCLHPPSEASIGLDLAKLEVQQSGMTFELDNIPDPSDPSKYLFAKWFAPGAHSASGNYTTWLQRNSATATQLDADSSTIYVQKTDQYDNMDAAGEAYLGRERFSYSAKGTASGPQGTLGTFTGVTKGVYPAYGTGTWGYTYIYAELGADDINGSQAETIHVSSVPFSFIGRRVGLYVTTWDPATASYNTETNAKLLWFGNIGQEITYVPRENKWSIPCESILSYLDRRMVGGSPIESELAGINLMGPANLAFRVEVTKAVDPNVYKYDALIVVPAGDYLDEEKTSLGQVAVWAGHIELQKTITSALNDSSNWTPSQPDVTFRFVRNRDDNLLSLEMHVQDATADTYHGFTVVFSGTKSDTTSIAGSASLPLAALGFNVGQNAMFPGRYHVLGSPLTAPAVPGGNKTSITGNLPPFRAFHPLYPTANSKRLYIRTRTAEYEYETDQADHTITAGHVLIGTDSQSWAYTGITNAVDGSHAYLALTDKGPAKGTSGQFYGAHYADPMPVQQTYVLDSRDDYDRSTVNDTGPLELLLYGLTSTGTSGYNGTYDKLPARLTEVGIQNGLIDTSTFTAIDADLMGSSLRMLARRKNYAIYEATEWIELWLREARLFALALVWHDGQIKARRLTLNTQLYTQTLDDSTNAEVIEWGDVKLTLENVINQWKLNFNWDQTDEKYKSKHTYRDIDSIATLGTVKEMEIKHPGVNIDDGSMIKLVSRELFKGRQELNGYPWQKVSFSLTPTLVNKIYVGDTVKYTSSVHPDPHGGGSMSTTMFGIVTDVSWNYTTWVGQCTVYLHGIYDTKRAWAASACTNITATNGGWDAANYRLTLLANEYGVAGDTDDGARFSAGDKIKILERSADNTPVGPWDATVASAYETDGANLLTLDTVTLTGWDDEREYVVVPDSYADCTATQQTGNAFLADVDTVVLGTSDQAHRYG